VNRPVPFEDERVATTLLRRCDARFVVRRHDGRARFTIANPDELSYEEDPWAIRLAIDLRRSDVDVLAFSVP
jgi:hypothetical protein